MSSSAESERKKKSQTEEQSYIMLSGGKIGGKKTFLRKWHIHYFKYATVEVAIMTEGKKVKRNPWWIQLTHSFYTESAKWVLSLILCSHCFIIYLFRSASYLLSSTYFRVRINRNHLFSIPLILDRHLNSHHRRLTDDCVHMLLFKHTHTHTLVFFSKHDKLCPLINNERVFFISRTDDFTVSIHFYLTTWLCLSKSQHITCFRDTRVSIFV